MLGSVCTNAELSTVLIPSAVKTLKKNRHTFVPNTIFRRKNNRKYSAYVHHDHLTSSKESKL